MCSDAEVACVPKQVQAGELEQVVSGASEGSGGQLARTSSHYMGPVASDSLAHTWMHHAWADTGHVLNRCPLLSTHPEHSCSLHPMFPRCHQRNCLDASVRTAKHPGRVKDREDRTVANVSQ